MRTEWIGQEGVELALKLNFEIKVDFSLHVYKVKTLSNEIPKHKAHYDSSPIKSCHVRVDLKEQASTFSTGHFFVLVSHPNLSLHQ